MQANPTAVLLARLIAGRAIARKMRVCDAVGIAYCLYLVADGEVIVDLYAGNPPRVQIFESAAALASGAAPIADHLA
jgi:hypothetical protein